MKPQPLPLDRRVGSGRLELKGELFRQAEQDRVKKRPKYSYRYYSLRLLVMTVR